MLFILPSHNMKTFLLTVMDLLMSNLPYEKIFSTFMSLKCISNDPEMSILCTFILFTYFYKFLYRGRGKIKQFGESIFN